MEPNFTLMPQFYSSLSLISLCFSKKPILNQELQHVTMAKPEVSRHWDLDTASLLIPGETAPRSGTPRDLSPRNANLWC